MVKLHASAASLKKLCRGCFCINTVRSYRPRVLQNTPVDCFDNIKTLVTGFSTSSMKLLSNARCDEKKIIILFEKTLHKCFF